MSSANISEPVLLTYQQLKEKVDQAVSSYTTSPQRPNDHGGVASTRYVPDENAEQHEVWPNVSSQDAVGSLPQQYQVMGCFVAL